MSMGRGYRNYNYRSGGHNATRGNSYRNNNYNNRMHGHMRMNNDRYGNQASGSSRYGSGGYHGGGSSGNNNANHGSAHHYRSRNRDRFDQASTSNNRHDSAGHKRSYRESSRERDSDRKKTRSEEYRRNTTSSTGRSQNSPPPPPPTISSGITTYRNSGNNVHNNTKTTRYNERNNSNVRHRTSPMASYANRPFRTNFEIRNRGVTGRGGNMRSGRHRGSIRVTRRDGSDLRIIRRKVMRYQHTDRRRVKITRLSSGIRRRRFERRISRSPRRVTKRANTSYVEAKRNKRKTSNSDREKSKSMTKEEDALDEGNENTTSKRGSSCRSDTADKEKRKSTSQSSLQKVDNYTEAGGENSDGENNSDKLWENEGKEEKKECKKKDTSYQVACESKQIKREHSGTARQMKVKEEDKKSVTGPSTPGSNSNRRFKRETPTPTEGSSDENNSSPRKKDSENKSTTRSSVREDQNNNNSQRRNSFIKLTCIHCQSHCVTFKEYLYHLNTRTHKAALRQIALRQRTHLLRLRARQRAAQRDIEEKSKDVYDSKFCHLCRLHYRLPKTKHQLSEHHKIMKKFLMPYCSICHLAFKSPMLYETHRCSLEHIKNKSRKQESDTDEDRVPNAIDLEKFMTVDSVGQTDGAGESDGVDSSLNEILNGVKIVDESDEIDENDENVEEEYEEEEEDDDDDDDDDDEDENGQRNNNTGDIYFHCNTSVKTDIKGPDHQEEQEEPTEFIGRGYVSEITVYYCKICNRYCTAKCTLEEYIKQHCTEKDHIDAFWKNKRNEDNTQNEGNKNIKSSNIVKETAFTKTYHQQTYETNNLHDDNTTTTNQDDIMMSSSEQSRPHVSQRVKHLLEAVNRDLGTILKTVAADLYDDKVVQEMMGPDSEATNEDEYVDIVGLSIKEEPETADI